MSVFQLGPILKARREELGLSQEDLADGICSVPTLSRIENGERMPTKNHFEILMQRLGYSALSLDFFTDKRVFMIHQLKIKIRYAFLSKDYSQAKKDLNSFEHLLVNPTKIDEQFVILFKTVLSYNEYSNSERLSLFESALKLTCPKYKDGCIPHALSYEEIVLLNNIAVCNDVDGKREYAINILRMLKEYYESHVISTDEALRTQPMILYNLSKYLGLSGRYDECIETCDYGIRIAKSTGRCSLLSKTLYNRAWSLIQRNCSGDMEAAEVSLRQAYNMADAMGKTKDAEFIRNFYKQTFLADI